MVRAQISVMMTQASQPPFNRDPSSNEIEEMAKTMCLKYPIIKSTCDDVSLIIVLLLKVFFPQPV